MEVPDHYRGQREALSSLVLGLTPDQLATVVPGCPLWTVREVVAHLTGLTADLCSGAMEGAGSPEWAQVQVDARAGHSIEEIVQEWSERGPGFEAQIAGMGFLGWVFTYDVTMHGDDVREALGLPLGASETHLVVLDGIIDRARGRVEGQGTLELHAADRSWTLGDGSPTASLTVASTGELGRVIGGRRGDPAVLAMDWSGDPEPWLPVMPLFREGR